MVLQIIAWAEQTEEKDNKINYLYFNFMQALWAIVCL